MPWKTKSGTHYHMTEGCCGADIQCGTSGLEPCAICCGKAADGGASVRQALSDAIGGPLVTPDDMAADPRYYGADYREQRRILEGLASFDPRSMSAEMAADPRYNGGEFRERMALRDAARVVLADVHQVGNVPAPSGIDGVDAGKAAEVAGNDGLRPRSMPAASWFGKRLGALLGSLKA